MDYQTQTLVVSNPTDDSSAIEKAADLLRQGELVAIPTETVYGLAANALDPVAVKKIYEAKGRPQDNPMIVHITSPQALWELTEHIPDSAKKLAEAFWPGPLTMILPRGRLVPDVVTAGMDTVAVRAPDHPVARAVIDAAGVPLAAPSANLSGRPSPTTAEHCKHDLSGRIPLILDGGPCRVGVESTVLSLVTPVPRVLRPGAITPEQIQEVIGVVAVDPAVYQHLEDDAKVMSPGMKYTHYSPKAKVVLVKGEWEKCRAMLREQTEPGVWALVFEEELNSCPVAAFSLGPKENPDAQARNLFALLRQLDEKGAQVVFARAPLDEGVGLAVYNRLIRAAGFMTLEL